MLRFRFRQSVPPGGKWFYQIPGTIVYFEDYGSYYALERKVKQYYGVNGLGVPDNLRDLIEDYICSVVTPSFCEGEHPGMPRRTPPLTFFEAVERTEKFYRGQGRSVVLLKEARDRAACCQRCSENNLGLCSSCNGLRALASGFVGGRKLPQDSMLGVCQVYRLPLNGLVHTQLKVDDLNDKAPADCWTRSIK